LLGIVSTAVSAPITVGHRLRQGTVSSARGAAKFLADAIAAARRVGAGKVIRCRGWIRRSTTIPWSPRSGRPGRSSPRGDEEHEREQRERAWSAPGESGQVGEGPSAHPKGGGEGKYHGDDQQQRGEQRAEQQGQHQKMTPRTIGMIRFRSCTRRGRSMRARISSVTLRVGFRYTGWEARVRRADGARAWAEVLSELAQVAVTVEWNDPRGGSAGVTPPVGS
jgi:hypothetical protein